MPLTSPSIKVAVRTWSKITLNALVDCSSWPYLMPVSSSSLAIAFSKISVSYTLALPFKMHSVLSKPIPVSTLR